MSEKKGALGPYIVHAEIELWGGYGNDRLVIKEDKVLFPVSKWTFDIHLSPKEDVDRNNKAPGP